MVSRFWKMPWIFFRAGEARSSALFTRLMRSESVTHARCIRHSGGTDESGYLHIQRGASGSRITSKERGNQIIILLDSIGKVCYYLRADISNQSFCLPLLGKGGVHEKREIYNCYYAVFRPPHENLFDLYGQHDLDIAFFRYYLHINPDIRISGNMEVL